MPEKVKGEEFGEVISVSSLLAIDTSMVIWTDIDLEKLGLAGGTGRGGGDGGEGGGGGPPADAGGGAKVPRRVRTLTFYALCNQTGHEPGDGVQENGIWVGLGHERQGDAAVDAGVHQQQTGHGPDTIVAIEIGSALAGPVT